ncbi:MAG: TIGR01459 family HAD-type hydrolase [Rickettsiales bacterium]|nr:TIGR01459 family HAD-type hydrolase [Rickettsiales bacterium]
MSDLTFKHILELADDYELLLLDLWGVLVEDGKTYPGVVETINTLLKKKDIIFLSNAPRPNYVVAKNLRAWGFSDVTPEMVVTSGDLARELVSNFEIKTPKVYHLGKDRNEDILLDIEHTPTDNLEQADILLLSIFRDEHEDIHEFDEFLKKAANLPRLLNICSNPDTTIPKSGIIRYCPGHFAGIIEQHGGSVIYTGKPETPIYELVFRKKPDIAKSKILMVGDTFETDILGANRSGIDSALVLTGNAENIHKIHDKLEHKLSSLESHAKKVAISPTFTTLIAK